MQVTAPSVWKFAVERDGQNFLLLGGVHGNELTGIETVRRLVARFESGDLRLRRGSVTFALGNLRAMENDVRFVDGRDLNRMFTAARLATAPDGTPEDARMRLLASLIAAADVTLDVHSTNRPSEPFVSSVVDDRHRRLYRWLGADKVLADPGFVLAGESATTDEYAEACGRIGICYESGQAGDTSCVDAVIASVVTMLGELGLLERTQFPSEHVQETYLLRRAIVIDGRPFRFADGYGTHSFQPVRAGDTIGFLGDDPIVAGEDGVLVFPKLPEHWQTGKPACYVAVRQARG